MKIKLVIADFDSRYLDRVTDYISSAHPGIRVTAFTRADLLMAYLENCPDRVDILLAHPAFLDCTKGFPGAELTVVLTDGSISSNPDGVPALFKYQPGDALVSRLVSLYSEKNSAASMLVTGDKDTKLVAVYSPAGGVGKTSVVLGLAAKLADMGRTVLVLSLESVNSSASALSCSGRDGMSYLLLSLQENPDLLPVKLEACKTHDSLLNIDFIEPAGCFMELSDAGPDDIHRMLTAVKCLGRYDVVLVDMDTAADKKMDAVFACCDRVILVQTTDGVCCCKTAIFLGQLGGAFGVENVGEKMIPLLNRYDGGTEPNLGGLGVEPEISIPIINDLWIYENDRCIFDPSGRLTGSLGGLARKVLDGSPVKLKGAEVSIDGGGADVR